MWQEKHQLELLLRFKYSYSLLGVLIDRATTDLKETDSLWQDGVSHFKMYSLEGFHNIVIIHIHWCFWHNKVDQGWGCRSMIEIWRRKNHHWKSIIFESVHIFGPVWEIVHIGSSLTRRQWPIAKVSCQFAPHLKAVTYIRQRILYLFWLNQLNNYFLCLGYF